MLRFIAYKEKKLTISDIVSKMAELGFKTSRTTIWRWVHNRRVQENERITELFWQIVG